MFKKLLAGAALAAAMATAGAASAATVYDLNIFDPTAGFSGTSLGSVTLTQDSTTKVTVDVALNSGVWFQMAGKAGSPDDSLAFDISGDPAVTYAFTTPAGGTWATNGVFAGLGPTTDAYGTQGWGPGFDYGVQVSDTTKHEFYGDGSHLIFDLSVASGTLSVPDFVSEHVTAGTGGPTADVFFVADLRQCTGGAEGTCSTGPVGATLKPPCTDACGGGGGGGGVPEPATWAMMLLGFGGLGATLRRHRAVRATAA